MIAVVSPGSEGERAAVGEFFELFKTPWEFHEPGQSYDVVLVPGDRALEFPTGARVVIVHGGVRSALDEQQGIQSTPVPSRPWLRSPLGRFPIYGSCLAFDGPGIGLVEEVRCRSVAFQFGHKDITWIRLGYDLFAEVGHLLTRGQPASNASVPTLERHIALLRALIVGGGVPLIEVPPIPRGYNFVTCLTHDIDHPAIKSQTLDRTILGFTYRAVIGTVIDFARGRVSWRDWATNWMAALKLPFVFFGLAADFWDTFKQYLRLEKGLGATYFFIPRKGDAGAAFNGLIPAERRAAYELSDVAHALEELKAVGCEIGVHGIDAWTDAARAAGERDRIDRAAGVAAVGIRMHWLYFTPDSPKAIEAAGFAYDSSCGYNEAVGYSHGTGQVFAPPGASHLLELPLIIMDTALFFPGQMNLSFQQAKEVVVDLIQETIRTGGVLTINWHDRSLAPERLWGGFYIWLLEHLKRQRSWFPCARLAVDWFRHRREISFERVYWDEDSLQTRVRVSSSEQQCPGFVARVHFPAAPCLAPEWNWTSSARHVDIGFRDTADIAVRFGAPARPLESVRSSQR